MCPPSGNEADSRPFTKQVLGTENQVPDVNQGSEPKQQELEHSQGLSNTRCSDLESQHSGLWSLDLPSGIGPWPGLGVGKWLPGTRSPGNLGSPSGK